MLDGIDDVLIISNKILDNSELQISENDVDKVVRKINFKNFFQSLNVIFPLRFENISDEFNFLLSNVLIQIDSVNSVKAEKYTDGSLSDALLSGMIGTHLSGEKWTGGYLRSLSKKHLTRIFHIPEIVWESVSLPSLPAVTQEVSHPSEAVPYLLELENVCNHTGLRLQALNKKDFADLFQVSSPAFLQSFLNADAVLTFLVESLPTFVDVAVVCKKSDLVKEGSEKSEEEQMKENCVAESNEMEKDGSGDIAIRNYRRAQLAVYILTTRFPQLFSFITPPSSPSSSSPSSAPLTSSSSSPTSPSSFSFSSPDKLPGTPSAILSSFFFIPTLPVTRFFLSRHILVPRSTVAASASPSASDSASASSVEADSASSASACDASSSPPSSTPAPSSSSPSSSAASSLRVSNIQRMCAIAVTDVIIKRVQAAYLRFVEKEKSSENGTSRGGNNNSINDGGGVDDNENDGDGGDDDLFPRSVSDINYFTVLEYFKRIVDEKRRV